MCCSRPGGVANLHVGVHVSKRPLGLVEEVKDDALTELAVARLFVHVEDLFEGGHVDIVTEVEFLALLWNRG